MINIFKKKLKPKYRLRPTAAGDYFLDRYDSFLGYMSVAIVDSPEEADKIIANLERETIYYREK